MTDLAIPTATGGLVFPTDTGSAVKFAGFLAESDLVPQAYRKKPANIILAVGLGQAMGLSWSESLFRIDVIQGKPTASAELIASNVRKAGHRLTVVGDDQSCTATITRGDTGEEYTVVRDLAWAKKMGLDSKPNYKNQPGTMLQWRAITGCARLACSEALYGVVYTPDELRETLPVAPTVTAAALKARTVQAEPVPEADPKASQATVAAMVQWLESAGVQPDTFRDHICEILDDQSVTPDTITEGQAQLVIDTIRGEGEVQS